jgi:biotin synthase
VVITTGLEREKLMEVDAVLKQAQEAKDKGATRFCMGAAWQAVQIKPPPLPMSNHVLILS